MIKTITVTGADDSVIDINKMVKEEKNSPPPKKKAIYL